MQWNFYTILQLYIFNYQLFKCCTFPHYFRTILHDCTKMPFRALFTAFLCKKVQKTKCYNINNVYVKYIFARKHGCTIFLEFLARGSL